MAAGYDFKSRDFQIAKQINPNVVNPTVATSPVRRNLVNASNPLGGSVTGGSTGSGFTTTEIVVFVGLGAGLIWLISRKGK